MLPFDLKLRLSLDFLCLSVTYFPADSQSSMVWPRVCREA